MTPMWWITLSGDRYETGGHPRALISDESHNQQLHGLESTRVWATRSPAPMISSGYPELLEILR